jgi:hypothetical protein
MVPCEWDGSDEYIVAVKLLLVGSKELLVELESSAPVVSDLEVSHLFSCITELLGIFDLDNSGIEWSGEVSSDLWLGGKGDATLALKDTGDLLGSEFLLWKVIKVDVVLVSDLKV